MNYPERGRFTKNPTIHDHPRLGLYASPSCEGAGDHNPGVALTARAPRPIYRATVRAPYFGASNGAFRSTQQFLI
jgi:hypothetical protein